MPLTQTSAVRQLSDGNSQGTILGRGPTDLIGFFGVSQGVVQPSGNAQAALTRGNTGGSVATYSSTQSPSGVQTATTVEISATVIATTATYQVLSGDMLFVNKPTNQAGIGLGNVRVSGNNAIMLSFANYTQGSGATITPTASQSYGIVALRNLGSLNAVLSPAAVPALTTQEQSFAVTGIRAGELVQVMKPSSQAGLDIVGMRAVANNVLGITYVNDTAAPITPTAAETYVVGSFSGLDAISNQLLVMENVLTLAALGTSNSAATSEQSFTVTGLTTFDTVTGVSKPTAQSGLGIVGYRMSGTNSIAINFGGFGVSVTPTANEVYGISIYRPNPAPPLTLISATITPAAVVSQSAAEQSFTVAGILSTSVVWVNKPTLTPGVGIAGVRASATAQIAINYCNPTAAAITPPSETYLIGQFNLPIPDRSAGWVQPAMLAAQQMATLGNAMRGALASMGLVAGA